MLVRWCDHALESLKCNTGHVGWSCGVSKKQFLGMITHSYTVGTQEAKARES